MARMCHASAVALVTLLTASGFHPSAAWLTTPLGLKGFSPRIRSTGIQSVLARSNTRFARGGALGLCAEVQGSADVLPDLRTVLNVRDMASVTSSNIKPGRWAPPPLHHIVFSNTLSGYVASPVS